MDDDEDDVTMIVPKDSGNPDGEEELSHLKAVTPCSGMPCRWEPWWTLCTTIEK